MIPVICIDDKLKPIEVLKEEWIKEGNKYHITHVFYHPNQGVQGVELKEIRLTERSKPFESYGIWRFAIDVKDLPALIEMIKNCTELNDVDIQKLIEESKLQQIDRLFGPPIKEIPDTSKYY